MLYHRGAAGGQGGEKIEALAGIVEQSDRAPADPGDEIRPARPGVGEVAQPGVTAILHHHVARPHGDAAQRFRGAGLGDQQIGEAAMSRLIARVQPPIAAVTGRPRDRGAVHQAEPGAPPWAPVAERLASHVGQQVVQHIGKEVAGLAQTIEQRDVAQLSDTGFGGVAGDTAQRQAAGTI
jgi:hypothetical protein